MKRLKTLITTTTLLTLLWGTGYAADKHPKSIKKAPIEYSISVENRTLSTDVVHHFFDTRVRVDYTNGVKFVCEAGAKRNPFTGKVRLLPIETEQSPFYFQNLYVDVGQLRIGIQEHSSAEGRFETLKEILNPMPWDNTTIYTKDEPILGIRYDSPLEMMAWLRRFNTLPTESMHVSNRIDGLEYQPSRDGPRINLQVGLNLDQILNLGSHRLKFTGFYGQPSAPVNDLDSPPGVFRAKGYDALWAGLEWERGKEIDGMFYAKFGYMAQDIKYANSLFRLVAGWEKEWKNVGLDLYYMEAKSIKKTDTSFRMFDPPANWGGIGAGKVDVDIDSIVKYVTDTELPGNLSLGVYGFLNWDENFESQGGISLRYELPESYGLNGSIKVFVDGVNITDHDNYESCQINGFEIKISF